MGCGLYKALRLRTQRTVTDNLEPVLSLAIQDRKGFKEDVPILLLTEAANIQNRRPMAMVRFAALWLRSEEVQVDA